MILDRIRTINILDKIILFSLYATAYFLPISKAIIEIFSTLAIVCYIVKKIIQREGIPKTPLNLAIITYAIICFFSIFISTNPQISARTFIGKTIQDILFFFVLVDAFNSERRVRNFLYILFLSSTLLGIDGIYQYFTHNEFIRQRPYIWLNRISATFSTSNDFGCYLYTVIAYVLALFFTKFRFKPLRFILAGLFTLLFTCLIMTVSRGAWCGFMASVLFLGIWIYPIGIFFLLLALFITITEPFYPPAIKERLNNFLFSFDATALNDAGGIERRIFWQAGWKMFMSKPWMGLGLGTFMFNFKKFVIESYQYGPAYAHNCYLQMLAELGVVGLVSFLLILVLFFYDGIKIIARRQKTFFWYILVGSSAAILGYSVQMAVETIFYSLDLGMLFWILLGLGTTAANNIKLENHKLI